MSNGTTFSSPAPTPLQPGVSVEYNNGANQIMAVGSNYSYSYLTLAASWLNFQGDYILGNSTVGVVGSALKNFAAQTCGFFSLVDQSIANNVAVPVSTPVTASNSVFNNIFNNEPIATYDSTNQCIHLVSRGTYLISANVRFLYAGNTVGHRSVWFEGATTSQFVDPTAFGINRQSAFAGHNVITTSFVYTTGLGQYVRCLVAQDSGVTVTLNHFSLATNTVTVTRLS